MTRILPDQDGLLPQLHQILKTFQHWCELHFTQTETYQFAAKEGFVLYHLPLNYFDFLKDFQNHLVCVPWCVMEYYQEYLTSNR